MPAPAPSPRFLTTRWSVVLAAGGARSADSADALEALCRAYWYPLYAFARRGGQAPEAAQDLVQGFFGHVLEKDALQAADPARGRFRSFLLTSFTHYTRNEHARQSAQRRGGGRAALSLDDDAEARFKVEPTDEATPDRLYERAWAVSLLERVLAGLRSGYVARGQGPLFDALKGHLVGTDARRYAETAPTLGLSEGAMKVAVHRLRDRYRRALRDAIADTVDGEAAVDDEVRALFAALEPPARGAT